jgi:hypothetical protein
MLQLIFVDSRLKQRPTKEGRSYFKKKKSFPLLKHHCSTTLCSFFIAETPLFNNFLTFPTAETPLFNNLPHHFSPSLFSNLSPFSPLPKHHCQQPFTIFPIAKTPLSTTFRHFPITKTPLFCNSSHFPIAETPLSTNFHPPPIVKTLQSNNS